MNGFLTFLEGPTGPTGPTGATGIIGATGFSFTFFKKFKNNLQFRVGDGSLIDTEIKGATGNLTSTDIRDYIVENTGVATDPSTQFLFFKEKIGITSYFKTLGITGDIGYTYNSSDIKLIGITFGSGSDLAINALLYFPTATGVAVPLVYNQNIIAGYTSQYRDGITQSTFNAKIGTFKEYKSLSG